MKSLDELDHPCRETCSGWQQGYEKGLAELHAENLGLRKMLEKQLGHTAHWMSQYADLIQETGALKSIEDVVRRFPQYGISIGEKLGAAIAELDRVRSK